MPAEPACTDVENVDEFEEEEGRAAHAPTECAQVGATHVLYMSHSIDAPMRIAIPVSNT